MKTLLEPTLTSKKKGDNAISKKFANEKMIDRPLVSGGPGVSPKKVKQPYFKFYKVYKNETAVVEVSANDFKSFDTVYSEIKAACVLNSGQCPFFSLPADEFMYSGFLSEIKAMKHAKAGALKHIAKLIEGGDAAHHLLLEYRETHYYDLNFHLTEKNITELELRSEFPARRTKKEFN